MKINDSNIKKAIKYLNNNECIGIPTETVYGLAANAYSNKATKRIFKLKGRPAHNPLIVHYYYIKDLEKDCETNALFYKLYKSLSPGPITYILKLKNKSRISRKVTNNKKTLGVRFPSHRTARILLKSLKYPLAAPSANISEGISPVTKDDVYDEFGEKIKFILDGGRSKVGVESTIINLVNRPRILRLGGLDISILNKKLKTKLKTKLHGKNNINAPGRGRVHYSPGIPIRLNAVKIKKDEAFILINKKKENNKNYFYLSKTNNLMESVKNLYKTLRKIRKLGYKKIAVQKIPNRNFGLVINDRLLRASKK
ncbi:L-threonylcarbamoyladenylate synthase [Candidatus Pelagibacter sp.]|nr:L-threonylcarbamoyladenylate synthase [Candidatus Pelagibacter sp.]